MLDDRFSVVLWEGMSDTARPKILALVKDIRKHVSEDKALRRFRVNPAPSRPNWQLDQILEQRANGWVQEVYGICCELWSKQGKAESSDFYGAIWANEIEPFINGIVPDLLLRGVGLSRKERQLLKERPGSGDRLVDDAHSKILTCERAAANVEYYWRKKLVDNTSEGDDVNIQHVRRDPEQATAPSRKQHYPIDPRKVEIASIKASGKNLSCLEICRRMDKKQERDPKLLPLKSWIRKSKDRTWEGNYLNELTRSAVRKYISLIKPAGA
jgi:hypothetical protein